MRKMKKAITVFCIVLMALSVVFLVSCAKDKNDDIVRTTIPRTTLPGEDETDESDEYIIVTNENGETVTDEAGQPVTEIPSKQQDPSDPDSGQQPGETTTKKSDADTPNQGGNNNGNNGGNNGGGLDQGPKAVRDAISILQSGRFYMKGSAYDGKETTPMKVAISGKNMYMETTMQGMNIAMLTLDGTIYLINPSKGAYWKPTKVFLKQMGMDELTPPDFGSTTDKSKYKGSEEGVLNGKKMTCYVYEDTEGYSKWYTDSSGKVVAFEAYKTDGKLDSRMTFEELSAAIPDGLLDNPEKRYKKGSINIFF